MSKSELAGLPDSFNLSERHAHFNEDGSVTLIDAAKMWSLAPDVMNDQFGRLLVSAFIFSENWPSWERHPHGEEMVYLLSGSATLLLRLPQGDVDIALTADRGYMIPKNIWHTVRTDVSCHMLFVTHGQDTEHISVAQMAQQSR